MHFPERGFALNRERLGVFGWEVEILGPWRRSTKIFDKLLVPPKRTSRGRVRIIKLEIRGYLRKQLSFREKKKKIQAYW